jgi:hypothetical protein
MNERVVASARPSRVSEKKNRNAVAAIRTPARQVGGQHVAGQLRPPLPPPHRERERGAEDVASEHGVRHRVRAGELLDRRVERAECSDAGHGGDERARRGHRGGVERYGGQAVATGRPCVRDDDARSRSADRFVSSRRGM